MTILIKKYFLKKCQKNVDNTFSKFYIRWAFNEMQQIILIDVFDKVFQYFITNSLKNKK